MKENMKRLCENCGKKIVGFHSVKITLKGIEAIKCLKCKNYFEPNQTAGTVMLPSRSNGPEGLERPNDCHCHCAIVITGLDTHHIHPGKGGWWKNGNCLICKS